MYDMSTVAFFVQLRVHLHTHKNSCVFIFIKVGIDVIYNWIAVGLKTR